MNMTDSDKTNLRKALRNLLAAGAIIATLGLLTGCSELHVKQDFDFELVHLPVPGTVSDGETVEIRFEIRHPEGRYDSNRYHVRYFPVQGAGLLRYGDSILQANDTYRIREDQFRMYYTARSDGEHTLNMVFFDDFSHEHELDFSFNKAADTTITLHEINYLQII